MSSKSVNKVVRNLHKVLEDYPYTKIQTDCKELKYYTVAWRFT